MKELKKLTRLWETPAILHQESSATKQEMLVNVTVVFVKVKGPNWHVFYQKVGEGNVLIIGQPESVRSMAFERWASNEDGKD